MGKWAERAGKVGNPECPANSAISANSPPNGTNDTNGTVTAMPANPLIAIRSWERALLSLDPCEPRPGFSIARWQNLYDGSAWWLVNFGKQAAHDGWGIGDLFGIIPQMSGGGGGLIDRLGNHRGLVMTADEACWRYLGEVPQLYRRGSWPDLQPFWEIDL